MPDCLFAALLLAAAQPADLGVDPAALTRLDAAIAQAIQAGQCPGAVVLLLREGQIIHRKAHGKRCLEPTTEPMTMDTIFDLASLTKPVATATAVLQLIEQGKLRLEDPVAKHWPAFAAHGKDRVTVEHLLLHTSGLIADNPLTDYQGGKQTALERIANLKLRAHPGQRFTYSDVGFIVLGQLVELLSGQTLDAYTQQHIFKPLGMNDTGFLPAASKRPRIAPTTRENDEWLRGKVHDPRARRMGGVAGHAGLFGTADDLAVFVRMLLASGRHNSKPFLQPATVARLLAPREVPGGLRTLGWDARTAFSSNRGEFLGGFGHTGFTGTSLWIDPASQLAVILLTNRVHPSGKGNVTGLRRQVATLAASAVVRPPFPGSSVVRTGLDVLVAEKFQRLQGKRVALITNHTGRDAAGNSTIDLLHQAPGVQLVALFSPEHGIRGLLDESVPDGKDEKTGLPVYSLYGKNRRPTQQQLAGVDTLVYDIQDIGCRFYTYITTLGYILETAASHRLKVVVLDRPNPIGGVRVEGSVLEGGKSDSFVAYHSIPIRHGMTVGELARLFNSERKIGADLEVVAVQGWRRSDLFDQTGLTWIHPSPNMRSLTAALLYPGVGLLETTNVSVGRGTDRPFEVIGAPWIDGRRLAAALKAANLPGIRFVPTRFKPTSSTHAGKECGGVQIYLSDWSHAEAIPLGFTLAATLRQLYPDDWQSRRYNTLLGNNALFQAVVQGEPASRLLQLAEPGRKAFLEVRQRYLLYPE